MDIKASSKIYIVESPSQADIKLGRQEGTGLSSVLTLANIQNECFQVANENDLIQAFKDIAQDVNKNKEGNVWIAIHLSLHGNKQGIGLTDGTVINWKHFSEIWMKYFTNEVGYFTNPINSQRFCPVYLCLSVCEGMAAKEMRNYSTSVPYFSLVAPTIPINWSDSLMAFSILYHTVIHKKLGFDKAIERMNLVNELDNVFQFDILDGWGIINKANG